MEDKQKKRNGSGVTAEEMAKSFSSPSTKSPEESRQYILSFPRKGKKTV